MLQAKKKAGSFSRTGLLQKELSPKGLLENLGHGRLTESAPVVPLLGGGETAIGEVAPDRPPLVGVLRVLASRRLS